jgi:hypothetical protein
MKLTIDVPHAQFDLDSSYVQYRKTAAALVAVITLASGVVAALAEVDIDNLNKVMNSIFQE